jgi:hypothetical protein
VLPSALAPGGAIGDYVDGLLFTVGPARIAGAVPAIINPIAIE